ncbi:hypothetical protein [Actinomyces ruminicola]|nr:hypothetical protein [Actinomyces ruminicola]
MASEHDQGELIDETETVPASGSLYDGIQIEGPLPTPRDRPPTVGGAPGDEAAADALADSLGAEVSPIDEVDTVPAGGRLEGNIDKEIYMEFRREGTRSRLAYVLGVTLILIVVVGAVGWLFFGRPLNWESFTAPILTLIATAAGFYFRDRQIEPRRQDR